MLVRERMTPDPVTVTSDVSVPEALRVMREKRVRRLPILDKAGKLVGIVSDQDLLYASPSPVTSLSVWEVNYLLAKLPVEQVMTRDVLTVTEESSLEEAARIMADNKVGGLPVLRAGRLVGIITETDLFKTFLELLGGRAPGVRVTALIPGAKGTLAKITQAVADAGGDIIALTVSLDPARTRWELTLKAQEVRQDVLVEALERVVEKIVDVREA